MGKPHKPRIGDKVKANGVTWEYKLVNTGEGIRTMMWTAQAKIGTRNGKDVKKRLYAASPDEGTIELLTLRKEFVEQLDEERQAELHPTVRQAFARYLEYKESHLSKNTFKKYEQTARLHLQSIMELRLDKVTREQLQAAVNAELEDGAKEKSIKYYVTVFNQVRSHFELSSITGLHYSDKAGGSIREDDFSFMAHAHDLPAPADVVKQAAEFNGGRLYRFVIFGLMSMRIGEICGMTYGDISEHDGRHYITLRRQRGDKQETWELKNRQSYRTLLLDEEFYKSLDPDAHEDNEFICPQNENTYRIHFRKFKKYCGKTREFTPHTLRHIYASHCVARGYNEVCVRMCGGWSIGKDVMSRFYIERNAKACDEFMLNYYEDLFGIRESEKPTPTPAITLTQGGKSA